MSDLTVARRYAGALLAEAEDKNSLEETDRDVALIGETVEASRELRVFLSSPVIPREKKATVLDRLFGERVSSLTIRLMRLLLEKGREALLASVATAYQEERDRRQGVVQADVRVAMDLSDQEKAALKRVLSAKSGADVRLNVATDRSVIGGVLAQIGDTVYDGTLRRRLATLKNQMERGSVLSN